MLPRDFRASSVLLLVALGWSGVVSGADWPAWRHDSQRSAASPEELPQRLQLHWTRQLPRLKPAWSDQPKMQFDAVYEPIVLGRRMFVGSPHDGSVAAYDLDSGDELWRYFSDGPVRFAPLGWQDKVYFVSDDGCLYCLHARDGTRAWRFRGGPSERKILGNERLISTWPARGAPVIEDGTIYFAAGIWPFMGIFLHALDAESGRVLWTNDGDGSLYIKQPHNSDSFAGVAPQGALVAIGPKLIVPGGRSVPACYDRASGRLVYYQLAENGKRGGGSTAAAVDRLLLNGGAAFDLDTEKYLGPVGELFTFANGAFYDYHLGKLRALDLATSQVKLVQSIDRKGDKVQSAQWSIDEQGKAAAPPLTALIKAGSRLYAGSPGKVLAFDLPLSNESQAEPAWEADLDGTPASLVAAVGKLLAATREGRLYCFGEPRAINDQSPRRHELPRAVEFADENWSARARNIVATTHVDQGYCVVWGVGTGGLVKELARQTALRMVVVDPDIQRANDFRDQLRGAGSIADRVSVVVADPLRCELPLYLASLIVAESLPAKVNAERDAFLAKTFASLRPYGGAACLPIPPRELNAWSQTVARGDLPGAAWTPGDPWSLLRREGALPDSANWTHEHADAANTRVSKDQRVKTPLGLLWFGGASNDGILPRHGHGPQPQVVDGRLFIEGLDMLRAMDIYTGRVLWEANLPGVGALYDNTAHQPGANASGTNYVSMPDGVYVAYRDACWRLDPATGKKIAEFKLPGPTDSARLPLWGYLNVCDNYLIGGGDPLYDSSLGKGNAADKVNKIDNDNFSSSGRLVVMDRHTGRVLWTAQAQNGFRHNAICIGGGRIYCVDRLSGAQLARYKRRGEMPPRPARLVAFDLATGAQAWGANRDVFGTWLSYSADRDVLVEAGRTARDTLSDEPKGMRAYRGHDGVALWENKTYAGPAMIHHDTILMAGNACDLLTGTLTTREHPLSGESVEWCWSRNYGCNTPSASEHLLTFRSGAAGYFDLCNDGGTGNFGGFRSSCTNNLIVAGGVLTAPDYTRTCTCSYQNQTSLALVHMPDVETWTFFGAQDPKQPIRRVGVNLGAPGDRKSDDGTLWLEYPSVGGASPEILVRHEPENVEWFRRHSSQITGDGLPWVASSGAKGLTSLRVTLASGDAPPRRYTVRLHFTEPDDVKSGQRRFGVRLQGKTVLSALDVAEQAGGRNRALVKEFAGILVEKELRIQLAHDPAASVQWPVLSGVEILAEGW